MSDLTSKIVDCEHKTAPTQETGFPSIRTPNIGRGRLLLENVNRVSKETYELWTKRAKPKHPDLILAREAPLGNVAMIPKNLDVCLGQRTVLLSPDSSKVDPAFLCYRLLSDELQNEMNARGGGSTVPHLNVKEIRELPLSIPDLPTQRRIASILSAYDDLIENNLRRIKLLEELAQRTYEEWFVRFRFPGHETAVFDAETGLPEGWERKRADSLFNIKIGKTPPRNEPEWFTPSAEGVKWASIKDINNASVFMSETSEGVTESAVKKFNMNLANEGTVILSFKLTLGKVTIVTEDMVTNEAIAHFSFKEHSVFKKSYVYCYLKAFNYDTLGSTSSIGTAINSKIVKALPFLVPEKEVLNSFQEVIEPVFDELKSLLAQNLLLKQSRDILLPKLMSGQLRLEGGANAHN